MTHLPPSTTPVPSTGRVPRPIGRQSGLKVPPKVRDACKLIVSEGLELDEAAGRVGLTTRALRLALERKHVLTFLKAEREVFRAYVSAQNIHHAKRLRDNGKNETAKINAIRYIDAQDDERTAAARAVVPGFVIVFKSETGGLTVDSHVVSDGNADE